MRTLIQVCCALALWSAPTTGVASDPGEPPLRKETMWRDAFVNPLRRADRLITQLDEFVRDAALELVPDELAGRYRRWVRHRKLVEALKQIDELEAKYGPFPEDGPLVSLPSREYWEELTRRRKREGGCKEFPDSNGSFGAK